MKTEASLKTLIEAGEFIGHAKDIPNETYHGSPGYSATDIITMGSDGFNCWRWKKAQPKEQTEAMVLGSATHLLLESRVKNDPTLVDSQIAVAPEMDRRTKVGKAAWEEFQLANEGKYILKQDDFDLARRMIDAVFAKPEVAEWFQGGEAEVSCFAKHPDTGILMKCRPDYLRVNDGLSINFKTTRDASHSGFIRSVADGAYDWQSAYYVDVLRQTYGRSFDEIHVLAEKNTDGAPIRIGVYTIDDDDLAFARDQYRQILERIPQNELAGEWPAQSAAIQTVKLPLFARRVVAL